MAGELQAFSQAFPDGLLVSGCTFIIFGPKGTEPRPQCKKAVLCNAWKRIQQSQEQSQLLIWNWSDMGNSGQWQWCIVSLPHYMFEMHDSGIGRIYWEGYFKYYTFPTVIALRCEGKQGECFCLTLACKTWNPEWKEADKGVGIKRHVAYNSRGILEKCKGSICKYSSGIAGGSMGVNCTGTTHHRDDMLATIKMVAAGCTILQEPLHSLIAAVLPWLRGLLASCSFCHIQPRLVPFRLAWQCAILTWS